eukprot:11159221-Lingulodinium_polyedra.AAC.1
MRSNQPCAVATVCNLHARAFHAHASFRCARGVRERAMRKPPRRRAVNSTAAACSMSRKLHNHAVEAT